MAQAPIMPVFTDALIGDTTHLSTEQFGAYVLILIATWRNNGKALPDDDKRMAHICRMSTPKWRKKFRNTLAEFFEVNDSGWHQQRLEIEWNRVARWRAQQHAKAKAGGLARATPRARILKGELRSPIQESESISSNTESLNAAREGEKNEKLIPLARCARLGANSQDQPHKPYPGEAAPVGRVRPRSLATNYDDLDPQAKSDHNSQQEPAMSRHGFSPEQAAPRTTHGAVAVLSRLTPPAKSPALKAKIRQQLASKHWRYLMACGRADEASDYVEAIQPTGVPPPELFDAVDRRMRHAGWDDMRQWKRQQLKSRLDAALDEFKQDITDINESLERSELRRAS